MIPREIRTTVVMAGAVVIFCFAMAFWLALGWHNRASRAKDGETIAAGRTTSAVEAIEAIGELNERGQVTDAQVEKAQNEIRQADPADRDAVARRNLACLQHRAAC